MILKNIILMVKMRFTKDKLDCIDCKYLIVKSVRVEGHAAAPGSLSLIEQTAQVY
ncbi:hypothetical protein [Cytobacillus oceanisediminis]|uniref:hypothetical protein n=1 Tax=Cytobacillus oceanisediminis TaxID=665099 RepID=UPI001C246532|nr:hypothetical protein [Cytobacillus oceanisediminis]MBU8769398.1 hypothetical protein [Cytobacillus oceanisediminis]MCM3392732.1 hypothetical protein [Cytobacillus oceanisediminis]